MVSYSTFRIAAASSLVNVGFAMMVGGKDVTDCCIVDHANGTVTLYPSPEDRALAEMRFSVAHIPKKKKTAQWKRERSRFGRY